MKATSVGSSDASIKEQPGASYRQAGATPFKTPKPVDLKINPGAGRETNLVI